MTRIAPRKAGTIPNKTYIKILPEIEISDIPKLRAPIRKEKIRITNPIIFLIRGKKDLSKGTNDNAKSPPKNL
jgi:hypothetical protein